MTSSEPLVTMVIRDSERSSVGATVRDSMLYPRAENRPTTRDSAPGSFSRSTEMMCLMGFISKILGSEQHFRQALAALHHRPDVLGLVGDEVHEHEPVLVPAEGLAQRGLHVGGTLDAHADMAVRLRELHEIGQRIHVRVRVAAAVLDLLPLAHHPEVPVV